MSLVNLQRRTFLAQAGAGAAVLTAGTLLGTASAAATQTGPQNVAPAPAGRPAKGGFWPGNTRLVVSISMQFEAGGQPLKGTDSPFPRVDFPDSVPTDPATNTWFAYGYREGIPRMLDLWTGMGSRSPAT